MIGIDDILRVHRHRQLGTHRPRADTVCPYAMFTQFGGLLQGQLNDSCF